jgi:DNA-binding transcriptional MerR regulator
MPRRIERGAPRRTIGVVAAELGISAASVRAWEKRGLLPPVRRSWSGRRVFTAADVRRLKLLAGLGGE